MKVPVKYADDGLFEVDKGAGKVFIPKRGGDRSRPPRAREKPARRKTGGKPRKKTGSAPHSAPYKKSHREDKQEQVKSAGPPMVKGHRRKKSKPKTPPPAVQRQAARKRGTLEDRLEYYRKKYGDNFRVAAEPAPAVPKGKPEKKSFFKKISTVFKGKKQKGI
jgi:ATP-dependent RNA helicase RhlB